MNGLRLYDLELRALNGLRRGRTTGSCAAAAVKAAIHFLLCHEVLETVDVGLPDQVSYLPVPIAAIERLDDGAIKASVIKYAGDDPDQTDGAIIFAVVRRNTVNQLLFFAGPGVGTATEPGLRVAIGEPAINPVPREMIRQSIEDELNSDLSRNDEFDDFKFGFDVEIGCVDGEKITKRTFNPRLGILGGISILGTTGIVEPMSLAAYQASIEVYIRVALAELGKAAFLPGNIGLNFAKEKLGITGKKLVHISNFIGFALDYTVAYLDEIDEELDELWLLGHPGKLAKILDDVWDTHSSKSAMATNAVADVAEKIGFASDIVQSMRSANTVEAIIEHAGISQANSQRLWGAVEDAIATRAATRLSRVKKLQVRLFNMSGKMLGVEQ
ncbi:MAG: cobalt-precorrin-5B (C(1))-methyltransferase CbiD [Candidatus Melainabacteria bacterium]|nr:cobalt-precorrin-5B (C(1))-methyltransferase CbiD [Candidatus Melainabacteria bacterium]